MGLFDRLKLGLAKSAEALTGAIGRALGTGRRLDAATAEELEAALLEADLGFDVADELMEAIRRAPAGQDPRRALAEAAEAFLRRHLPATADPFSLPPRAQPEAWLLIGVNGAGKTTTLGKMAARFAQRDGGNRAVLVAAGDTFRAGAREQLEVWASRAGVAYHASGQGVDPAALAFDAVERARAEGFGRVLIDTAGRLQNRGNLMDELKKVHRVCGKAMEGAPHEVLLVLDGTNGQNMASQARLFAAALPVTGLAITKLDGTSRAGALLPVARELKLPVRLVGVGEALEDLQPFEARAFCRALAGLSEVDA